MDDKIKEMEVLLEKMRMLLQTIKISPATAGKMELDMLHHYTREFYGRISDIPEAKNIFSQQILKEEIPVKKQQDIEPPQEKIKEEEKPVQKTEIKEPQEEINPYIKPEIKTPEVKQEIKIPDPVKEIKKEEPPVIIPPQKKPLSVTNKNDEEEEVSSGLHTKLSKDKKNKNSDLRSAIDLNDKLFLIRELFRGDHNTYEKVIRGINERLDMADAKRFIDLELIPQYGWNKGSAGIMRLYQVLSEKFD